MDRASAEQGVEMRAPLLDWDLVAFARKLPPEIILFGAEPKALLKRRLREWPNWFVRRRKMGFTYHLRWAWMMSNFVGLREMICYNAIERFGPMVPPVLRQPPANWSQRAIMSNFPTVWSLLYMELDLNDDCVKRRPPEVWFLLLHMPAPCVRKNCSGGRDLEY